MDPAERGQAFEDTVPGFDLPQSPQSAVPAPPAAFAARAEEPSGSDFPVEFSGVGSEYFKIWIVNLALTIVTVGVYSAWGPGTSATSQMPWP